MKAAVSAAARRCACFYCVLILQAASFSIQILKILLSLVHRNFRGNKLGLELMKKTITVANIDFPYTYYYYYYTGL